MRNNKLALVIVLVLAALALVLWSTKTYTTLSDAESEFKITDTASVTKIFIADKNVDEVLLERQEIGWRLNKQFKANTHLVDFLLGTMRRLKVKAPVPLSSHNNVVARMAAHGVKIEIYQTAHRIDLFDKVKLLPYEKRTRVFFVGDATQDNLGTHMLMEGADQPYVVYIPGFRGFLSSRFTPKVDDWKSHVVFNHKLSDIKSVSVQFTEEPESSYTVEVVDDMGNFDLSNQGKKLESYDTLKVLNFLTSFRDLRYETRMNTLLAPEKIDSIINSPSLYEISLVDHKQDTVSIIGFKKAALPEEVANAYEMLVPVDHDRFFALINDGADFVLLQYYVFDKILYPVSYFRKE